MWRISGSFVVSAVSRRWWWLRARGCPVPLRTGPGVLPQGSSPLEDYGECMKGIPAAADYGG
ncbi:hypothetical protein F2Q68_00032448 [Brassica cretica]|uniref:Uncharacterized protein n=2 Tax=Brassica cretica TaxID=69181 RepID=A0A8S9G2Y1_BRACR|nr:hypothetical protein F2Q68_00032450 [Brassica cretica]KAF2544018.1 hypothetical protein F2Q68_00032448 [Brassica cretica]KAF3531638.1 hypothetical protein DY000_02042678 [Brassica cretica]